MKLLTILGSTGSIGRNTLNIITRFPDQFQIKALTARSNVTLLTEQIKLFKPEVAVVFDSKIAQTLKKRLPPTIKVEILHGAQGYCTAAALEGVDMVVGAMVGAAGLEPILAAAEAGKDIALANKETLVMAGDLVIQAVARKGVHLLPIDSEHSAVFQCLQGEQSQYLDKIMLTASGGPFLHKPAGEFQSIQPEDALKHPNWEMGAKITIDSATMMNKGLEVIEAKWLFNVTPTQIEVLIHPQSIVHSMVAYQDGSIMAQLGIPDMQVAIAYALSYPQRLPLQQSLPDLTRIGKLSFAAPDLQRFPCLGLAFEACHAGGTLPAVLNAANEVAVQAFLNKQIGFLSIHRIIEDTMARHDYSAKPDLGTIQAADTWARQMARQLIKALEKKR